MSQFMEVIEWLDSTGEEMVHRIPEQGSGETKLGAQLIVRESQAAVFFRDGKGLDVFGPGRHTLTTMNLPLITKLLSLPFGFTSPFRCETYFINLKVFNNMKWGTKEPVAFRDSELGLVRLRAFGNYTMRIQQPLLFINTLVGTRQTFSSADIDGYLKDVIVSRLNDLLGEVLNSILDLPKNYDELGVAAKMRLTDDFKRYGIELIDFFINSITPPEEVQRMIDERSGMGVVGDMNKFMQFRAAKAIGDAAQGGAGGAGSAAAGGLGVGVGAGLGMMIPGMVYRAMGQSGQAATPEEIQAKGTVQCTKCHCDVPITSRFCMHCGEPMVVGHVCHKCGMQLPPDANFCLSCPRVPQVQCATAPRVEVLHRVR